MGKSPARELSLSGRIDANTQTGVVGYSMGDTAWWLIFGVAAGYSRTSETIGRRSPRNEKKYTRSRIKNKGCCAERGAANPEYRKTNRIRA